MVAGRPPLFNRAVAAGIISAFRNGKNLEEIAKEFNLARETILDWKRKNKKFSDAISDAMDDYFKHGAEKSLKDLVEGKTETRVIKQTFKVKKDHGGKEKKELQYQTEETVTHPPDYRAVKFTLHNRFRNRWSKPSVNSIDFSNMSDEQLADLGEMIIELRNKRKGND